MERRIGTVVKSGVPQVESTSPSLPSARYQAPSGRNDLILAWLRRARESQLAHYEMARILSSRAQTLGVPVILITAAVGTSAFASIAAEVIPLKAKLAIGFLSVIAAVLSSLQTFFRYSERTEKHRMFGARFGAVRRELEHCFAEGVETASLQAIADLRQKLDHLATEAPYVPADIFYKIESSKLP